MVFILSSDPVYTESIEIIILCELLMRDAGE